MQSLSCGLYEYVDNELCYSPEIEWPIITGTAKFVKKALILNYRDMDGSMRVEIPFRIVESIVATSRPTTALILTLWEAPRFFRKPDLDLIAMVATLFNKSPTPPRQRLTGVPHDSRSHQKILGQALVYRISVSPMDFHVLSNQLIQREVVSVIRHDIPILSSSARLSLTDGFENLQQTIKNVSTTKTVPFEVLFQVEALARNNYLPPWIVERLLWKVVMRYEEARSTDRKAPKDVSNCPRVFS